MEYNKYLVFIETVRQGNISKAAKELGYTQSGVSHTIKRLEEEMGICLFHRNRDGVTLTSAGRELYPYIAKLIKSQENLEQAAMSINDIHMGTLNIGTYSSVARQWLPPIIRNFKMAFPNIRINFREGGAADIHKWIVDREVDIGFASHYEDDDLEWIELCEDPLLAVLSEDDLISGDGFPLEAFNDRTFILSTLGVDMDIHRVLKQHSIRPDVQYTAKDELTIISMVSCGLGISILPKLVLDGFDSTVKTMRLIPEANRKLGITLPGKETASPAALKFIEYTLNYINAQKIL